MAKPVLMAVHDVPGDLRLIERELTDRYARDYQILCLDSPGSALQRLAALRANPEMPVLVLFAAVEMAAMTGVEFLRRARRLPPQAQRVLLIPWSNRSASKPVLRLITQRRIDRYAVMPTWSAEESFHHLVSGLLRDWQLNQPERPAVVTMVDQRWGPRSHEIRHLLQRGGIPFVFHPADSPDGRALP